MSKSILVIEDDDSFRESLKKLLEKEGYHVLEADSGEAGMEILKRGRPDLILLDLYLGGITGLEFLERTARPDRPPVIMLTAFGDWGIYADAMAKGACDCIAKPVKKSDLMSVIGEAMK
ncbi:MAG: response regulator [Candidatus Omnitrophica bacterium]|nr:response regulator [Candidatus Omnitrophota bacterium]